MSHGRKLSDQQIDEMAGLRERGWGIDRIAEHFTSAGTPVSVGAISWQCLRVGADAPPKFRGKCSQPLAEYRRGPHIVRPYSEADDQVLREMDVAGASVTQMARKLGRRSNSIRGRLMTLARREARAEAAE